MRITVIIPTWNEAQRIAAVVEAVARASPPPAAVIVADCDSEDATARLARQAGARVITGAGLAHRAAALNAGAAAAPPCEALFFLHADTDPPDDWPRAIAEVLADPLAVGGAFGHRFAMSGLTTWQKLRLKLILYLNRARYHVSGVYFGDQGLFVRPEAFGAVGGFAELSLMEDAAFIRALRRHGKLRLARCRVTTSPRRFLRHGIIRQGLLDQSMLIAHRLRLPATSLHAWYNREKQ